MCIGSLKSYFQLTMKNMGLCLLMTFKCCKKTIISVLSGQNFPFVFLSLGQIFWAKFWVTHFWTLLIPPEIRMTGMTGTTVVPPPLPLSGILSLWHPREGGRRGRWSSPPLPLSGILQRGTMVTPPPSSSLWSSPSS